MTGKQLRRNLHNEERVPFAVTPRKGGGDEAEVCPQVVLNTLRFFAPDDISVNTICVDLSISLMTCSRVKEKEAELKEAEKELHAKFDKMKQVGFAISTRDFCSLFQTVADEKRVVDEQRRTLDEEIADFQRRKVERFFYFYICICAVFHLPWL